MEKIKIQNKLEQFTPGDLIEFKSLFHSHWGVYVGDGKIIHSRQVGKVSPYDILLGRRLTVVEKTKLELVEEKGELRQNNFMDNDYEPRNPDEIVKIAETMCHFAPTQAQDCFPDHIQDSKQFACYCRYKNFRESNEIKLQTVGSSALAGIMGLITYSIFHR